ncbi:rhomboid family intramembrane serine protease [Conexibacter sp. CPCC 206217]|uniref:rhomboid family intramembrane serine protease n=1 Tax=Conexibacter sp. CPCC 206217 TaxID=3064574 RepID=UPI002728F61F|nr:rhomboid family intramembrane serine protease [Conexibacter sp. CPCC 206217]MDO8213844.1 rhomboid family intramembrane serine protease [Conexibacter sp. CPCC 206217]
MLPLKDNLPTDRLPIVTIALIAANVAAWFVLHDGGFLVLLVDVLFMWWFGPSVEDSMSRPRFALLCLLGGGVAFGLQALLDGDAVAPAATVGAMGAVAAVLGGYAVLYARARVLSVVPLPLLAGLVELPALVLLAVWFALQALLAATSLGDVAGDGGAAFLAQLGGFGVGLLAIKLLVQRPKPIPAHARGALS